MPPGTVDGKRLAVVGVIRPALTGTKAADQGGRGDVQRPAQEETRHDREEHDEQAHGEQVDLQVYVAAVLILACGPGNGPIEQQKEGQDDGKQRPRKPESRVKAVTKARHAGQ